MFGAAFAAAIGALAGLLFAPKPGKQLRKDIAKQAGVMRKNLEKTSSEIQERVHNTFQNVGSSLEQHYSELKAQVLAAIEQLDSKTKLTQKRFNTIVEEVVELYAKGKEWTEETMQQLIDRLKKEWENFKK